MATPNIINVATITPKIAVGAITTSRASVVDVPAENCAKINSLVITNIDGTNAATVTAEVSTNNGSDYTVVLASTISVPADASLVLVGKDNGFYLDETDILALTASANSDLTYLVSYELLVD